LSLLRVSKLSKKGFVLSRTFCQLYPDCKASDVLSAPQSTPQISFRAPNSSSGKLAKLSLPILVRHSGGAYLSAVSYFCHAPCLCRKNNIRGCATTPAISSITTSRAPKRYPTACFWLYSYALLLFYLPIETVIYENQQEYYEMLNISDKNSDSTSFIKFMLTAINKAIHSFANPAKINNDYVAKLIRVLGNDTLSAVEIMKKLKLKNRANFRKNYLVSSLN